MKKIFITIKLPTEKYAWYNKIGVFAESRTDAIRQAKALRKSVLSEKMYAAFKNTPSVLAWAIYENLDDILPLATSKNWKNNDLSA